MARKSIGTRVVDMRLDLTYHLKCAEFGTVPKYSPRIDYERKNDKQAVFSKRLRP
jgi:hypothetical protein